MKVMSFRTTQEQIDVLHSVTHCSAKSASQIIRLAIDQELESMLEASKEGIHELSKEREQTIQEYLDWASHQDG